MITVVGVGALGSHVALLLRNEKLGLKIIDFDKIEMKNTQSQFHSTMAVGKNKALALQQSFQGLFGVKVAAIPHRLTTDNTEALLGGSTLVIDCTDRITSREVIIAACKKLNLPLLHGALAATGDFGQIIWTEHFVPDAESGDAQATCVDGEHLPFHGVMGAFLAVEAQRFLRRGTKQSWQISPAGMLRLA